MLTQATPLSAADRRFLQTFVSDEEDAPWMSVTDWHLLALIAALLPLRWFRDQRHSEWYIGSELAVYFRTPEGAKKYVVPDLFVALADNHPRTSFDSEEEGGFPLFVLEIVSEESLVRDSGPEEKVRLYGLLGVQEYAIFDPEGRLQPPLQGYQRRPDGGWVRWATGRRGELVSGVLGLTLIGDGTLLRLEDGTQGVPGRRLLTADEERARAEAEQRRADREQAQAQQERTRAEQERARAEAAEARITKLEARLKREQPPA